LRCGSIILKKKMRVTEECGKCGGDSRHNQRRPNEVWRERGNSGEPVSKSHETSCHGRRGSRSPAVRGRDSCAATAPFCETVTYVPPTSCSLFSPGGTVGPALLRYCTSLSKKSKSSFWFRSAMNRGVFVNYDRQLAAAHT
jgi:hypothetical protein